MRYPKFLEENGTIGFVAPSCGCATEPYRSGFDSAQKKWREMGYRLWLGPNCYAGDGVGISSTPSACGRELTDGWCDPKNDCLISCGGGELMCEILDYVDFERIAKAEPKWYLGYSDNTNFTFLLTTLCDTASVYGPCAGTFGMEPWHESLTDAMALLRGEKLTMTGYDRWEKESLKGEENPCAPYNLTETSVLKYLLPDGRTNVASLAMTDGSYIGEDGAPQIDFSGRLLGGCMDCLVNFLGTGYDKVTDFVERYRNNGILWFLEACDLNLMGIRRAMWQMEHAGWFKHCSGFLIGRPRIGMDAEEFGIDEYQAATEMLRKYHVPVLMDVDIGHLPPSMPLICGSMARVTSDGKTYRVEMELR
ncbi:MAG: LD-carboxypeptidase [Bacteroidales bacterium]|nr:LD-carboxypeptidase [Bacteroidales bacterium]MCM1415261.1 LD-carboxypeptidase [bacterium]MCM1423285.1 LD-carboxypeptidase [bacterium]